MPPRAYEKRHGSAAFWRELARHPDFYGTLPLMPDAKELFAAVRHLIPVILTGLPRGAWAAPQQIRWAARTEEHTSEPPSLKRISYAVFCMKRKISNLYHIVTSCTQQNTLLILMPTHLVSKNSHTQSI